MPQTIGHQHHEFGKLRLVELDMQSLASLLGRSLPIGLEWYVAET
jgi:hypothetical protein